jgi:polysaccharide biosynthesis/export protein
MFLHLNIEFLIEYALKPALSSTIKDVMLRSGMGPYFIGVSCHPVRQVLVALFLLFVACGSLYADNDTTPATPLQATTPADSSDSVPTETASSTYRLQPYDLIDVDVYNEADLHKPARLGSDGTVLLPLIGSVKVGGMTVAEATDEIAKRYGAGYVKSPSVLITVLQYRKSTFSILGQVLKPGIYEIPEGANVNILEAVSLAGGYVPKASQNSITVKRLVDGKETMVKIKAGDMAQDPNVTPFVILPGDSILVPASQYEKSDFSILGQVQKPGLYEVPEGGQLNIIDAISLAGGCTAVASQNSITVKRLVNGKLTILPIRAADMAQDPNTVPFTVLPGDSIYVPYRANSTFSILGQVEKPGIYEIPEGTHLNIVEAILTAGGYTRIAAENSVVVKRTVNGKIMTIKVRAADMAQKPDLVPFEVLPGDIIKVNESIF